MKKKLSNIVILFSFLSLTVAVGVSSASDKDKAIAKAKDGYTVEELFTKKDSLNGKKVSLRGKVVKVNSGIMGKNWLHLVDGSGKQGTNDITITTAAQTAQVGDIVLAAGVMAADKDFGGGYKYKAIVEDASVTVEK